MAKSCEKINRGEYFVLDAFFHIFTLCLVLGIFFFLVVSKLEKKSLNKEIKNAIDDGFQNIPPNPNTTIERILSVVKNTYPPQNEADKVYNDGLKKQCAIILGLLLFGLICVWLTMKWSAHKCPNLPLIIFQNILLFGSIGVVEYLFFTHIASKFIPVMPSFMIQVINNEIHKS